jgi:hypothetical protein
VVSTSPVAAVPSAPTALIISTIVVISMDRL